MTGILCPECQSPEGLTVDSRPHASGHRRRRRCVNGHRFNTIEIVVSEKPRRLVGNLVEDAGLAKAKLIARITAFLEKVL